MITSKSLQHPHEAIVQKVAWNLAPGFCSSLLWCLLTSPGCVCLLPPPTFIFHPSRHIVETLNFLFFLKLSLELQSTMKIAKFLLSLLPLAELSLASRQQRQHGKPNCSSTGIVPGDLLAGITGISFVSRSLWLETLHANSHTAAKTGDVSPAFWSKENERSSS